jgi:hypothetical protein
MKNNTTSIMVALIMTAGFMGTALVWQQQQPQQQAQAKMESESSSTSCVDNQPCHTSVWNSKTPQSSKLNHNKFRSLTSCVDNQPCHTSVWNSSTPESSASSPTLTPYSPKMTLPSSPSVTHQSSSKSNHNNMHRLMTCMDNQPCHTSVWNSSTPQSSPSKSNHNTHRLMTCMDNQPCHTSVWDSSTPESSSSSPPLKHQSSPSKSNHNNVHSSTTTTSPGLNSTESISKDYPPVANELSDLFEDALK